MVVVGHHELGIRTAEDARVRQEGNVGVLRRTDDGFVLILAAPELVAGDEQDPVPGAESTGE